MHVACLVGCFVVAEFLLTSASRGPSAIAEPLVYLAVSISSFSVQLFSVNLLCYYCYLLSLIILMHISLKILCTTNLFPCVRIVAVIQNVQNYNFAGLLARM